jgi:hypothetical protein
LWVGSEALDRILAADPVLVDIRLHTGAWSLPLGTTSARAIDLSDRFRLPAVGLVPRGAP